MRRTRTGQHGEALADRIADLGDKAGSLFSECVANNDLRGRRTSDLCDLHLSRLDC